MLTQTFEFEIKKSKFIAYYYNVNDKLEVEAILSCIKKEHKKARHIVYAYKINQDIKKHNDGEPSNTAGTPIYNLIIKNDLNYCLIVVVRYFGGIKLGAGPLTRAYFNAANEVVKNHKNNKEEIK